MNILKGMKIESDAIQKNSFSYSNWIIYPSRVKKKANESHRKRSQLAITYLCRRSNCDFCFIAHTTQYVQFKKEKMKNEIYFTSIRKCIAYYNSYVDSSM